jgi:YD repeat-containing protein
LAAHSRNPTCYDAEGAVLALLDSRVDGRPFGSFHQLTWNTYASVSEETVLDSRTGSAMEVYYGGDQPGAVTLERRAAFDEEFEQIRRIWRVAGDHIEVAVEVPDASGDGWTRVAEAEFDQ